MNISSIIKRNPVASFIVLTLGLSFTAFLLPIPPESAFVAVVSVDVMIPTLIALALVTLMDGRRGAVVFLQQTFRWRSPLKWYLIALAVGGSVPVGSGLLALVTGRIAAIELAAPTRFFNRHFSVRPTGRNWLARLCPAPDAGSVFTLHRHPDCRHSLGVTALRAVVGLCAECYPDCRRLDSPDPGFSAYLDIRQKWAQRAGRNHTARRIQQLWKSFQHSHFTGRVDMVRACRCRSGGCSLPAARLAHVVRSSGNGSTSRSIANDSLTFVSKRRHAYDKRSGYNLFI